ncbi:L-2-amino-thiazoline-4-carboxylic acid hydrolase [[Eubacterium] cellulosolvens]
MSLKLRFAARWTPESILLRELDRVAELTTGALDSLLNQHAPGALKKLRKNDRPLTGDLKKRRAAMASAHNARVRALIDAIGLKETQKIGRQRLFKVGVQLGREARVRLGVGDDINDLVKAAKVLYKVLGIDFELERRDEKSVILIHRCALAKYYTSEACLILSAADEGVVKGLNPKISMAFEERITAGASKCIARLELGT